MRTLLSHIAETIRTSFWFVPSLLVLSAFIGAAVMVGLDDRLQPPDGGLLAKLIYSGNADGARTILGTIAGAMMTIAGVVFSLTMITLTLASSQFGPRLIRNFMKSRGNQIVLGTFIATFIYCLLVLLAVRETDNSLFVPGFAVSTAVLIAVINAAMLVWFIHHLASVIQADLIVAEVGQELEESLEQLFPEHFGWQTLDSSFGIEEEALQHVVARSSAYLRSIHAETLFALTEGKDRILAIGPRPGEMLMPGAPLVTVYGSDKLSDADIEKVHRAFLIGKQRTAEQDSEFAVRQLVEVALRALSPGINDPFTAMTCIDHLGAALCRLGEREFPGRCLVDDAGKVRLVVEPLTFSGLFHAAFDQLRQIAPQHAAVTIHLLDVLARLSDCLNCPDRQRLVADTGRSLAEQAMQKLDFDYDRNEVQQRLDTLLERARAA